MLKDNDSVLLQFPLVRCGLKVTLIALAFSLGATVPAQAIPIKVSFTATSFTPYIGTFVPQETVTGAFDYNAPSVTSDAVTSLNSVNLTIDGHTYTLADVAASAVPGEAGLLDIGGGAGGGPLAVTSNTDDFFMGYYPGSDTPVDFVYAIPGTNNTWTSSTFSQFSVAADAVAAAPEPASWLICLTGITGLGLFVAHRRRLNDGLFHRTGHESGPSPDMRS